MTGFLPQTGILSTKAASTEVMRVLPPLEVGKYRYGDEPFSARFKSPTKREEGGRLAGILPEELAQRASFFS